MQITAQGFLVYELTRSPAYLGYVGFAAGLPSWLFMLYGGVAADRMSRRTLLVITQTAMMVLAFILAGLAFSGLVQPWHIIVLAFLLGTANAFDAPARLAFVPELVAREDLTNAIALNSAMFNIATVLGPAIAGVTYAALGPAWCFTINGVSFLAVIAALLAMRIKPFVPVQQTISIFGRVKEGLHYALRHPLIRVINLNLAMVSLFALGFITLMPAWAVDVLGGDATTNGLLQSSRGLGALVGALWIAALGGTRSRGQMLTLGSFLMPVFLVLFSTTRQLPLSMVTLFGAGLGFMVMMNSGNALVQVNVPDELRGRVMSLYSLIFFGLMPIGALINGQIATRLGPPTTVLTNAVVMVAFAALIYLRVPDLRATR